MSGNLILNQSKDNYLPEHIKFELDKFDVLLNMIHVIKDTHVVPHLELQAWINLKL